MFMKMNAQAVTWEGKKIPHVYSVIADGDTEEEVLKKATEQNPQFKEILEHEPHAQYDENGRIINADEIRKSNYVILIPLE